MRIREGTRIVMMKRKRCFTLTYASVIALTNWFIGFLLPPSSSVGDGGSGLIKVDANLVPARLRNINKGEKIR